MRMLCALAGAVGLLVFSACPAETAVSGELVLGTFQFKIAPRQDDCGFERRPDGGSGGQVDPEPFVGTLSIDKEGRAWLVSGPTRFTGTLDGHRFDVTARAQRDLPRRPLVGDDAGYQCGCPGALSERIVGRLYGPGQLAGGCSSEGMVDAGPPYSPGDAGVDVRLICGDLSDEMSPLDNAPCACDPCLVVYAISGERQ